LSKTLVL